MLRIRPTKKYLYLILAAFSLAVGYVFWSERSADLKFRSLSYPQGFRKLEAEYTYSRIDPFFGLKNENESNASESNGTNVCDELFRDSTSPTSGNSEAKINIVEFFDYQCPYCKELSSALKRLQEDNNRVRIVYKEWPILGASSELAARAALAAAKQGRYLEVHYRLMSSGFIPTVGYIKEMAADLGLDLSLLRRDMKSSETTLAIKRTSALATKLGFIGTPSLVVGRTIVPGAITRAQLKNLVKIEIASMPSPLCRTIGSL